MKMQHKTAVLLISALSLVACGRKTQILIDGSSTVYPITEAVAEEFHKTGASAKVTVGVSGTGGGFKKFCNGETDISDASRPIKSSEAEKCKAKGIEYLELAVAYDGLAVVANHDNAFATTLTVDQLKKIFNSEKPAMTWKEADGKFPAEKIKIFAPGQDSGTFDYFVEVILGKDAKLRNDSTFSEDDNVLVTGIAGDKNAMGFFGLAYYEENKDKLKLIGVVNPKTKKAVTPNLDTVRSGEYAPLSRPIFIYVSKKANEKAEVKELVNFYLEKAGQLSKEVGYIPLPDEKYQENKTRYAGF